MFEERMAVYCKNEIPSIPQRFHKHTSPVTLVYLDCQKFHDRSLISSVDWSMHHRQQKNICFQLKFPESKMDIVD